jgi:hypothetical protein
VDTVSSGDVTMLSTVEEISNAEMKTPESDDYQEAPSIFSPGFGIRTVRILRISFSLAIINIFRITTKKTNWIRITFLIMLKIFSIIIKLGR